VGKAAKVTSRTSLRDIVEATINLETGSCGNAQKGFLLVFVLSHDKQPLDPCHPARARELLNNRKAAVFRRYPFTIILKARLLADSAVKGHRLKLDPGSKTSGIAVVQDGADRVVFAAELTHRGQAIRDSLLSRRASRRSRRQRHTRYRQARFLNRRRPEGWLAPSLRHRVRTTQTWVARLRRACPITAISMELVRFDTQLLNNAEISGVAYQQGELAGYEVREYLLEKWNRTCAYCGKRDVPLQIEHLTPRARGGSDRIANLALACEPCNQKKGPQTAAEFGFPQLARAAKAPLKDAAAANSTRWALYLALMATGLPLEVGTGGRTKFNRTRLGLAKAHWADAASVGASTANDLDATPGAVLLIAATGHGTRQMCGTNKYGFPTRHKSRQKRHFGFQTGDLVKAVVPRGKYEGTHVGRVAVRASGSFNISTARGLVQGISWKRCGVIHAADGYGYTQLFAKAGRVPFGCQGISSQG
jgi:5-methylcytosine-specific restriction endonuclease McrA